MSERSASRLWLFALLGGLVALWALAAARAGELARVRLSAPGTVVVERDDATGAIRVAVEVPAPGGPDSPTPDAPLAALVTERMATIPEPVRRDAMVALYAAAVRAADLAAAGRFGDAREASAFVADQTLLALGAAGQQYQAAVLRAAALLHEYGGPGATADRAARFRDAVRDAA